jgi:hypothetical protein
MEILKYQVRNFKLGDIVWFERYPPWFNRTSIQTKTYNYTDIYKKTDVTNNMYYLYNVQYSDSDDGDILVFRNVYNRHHMSVFKMTLHPTLPIIGAMFQYDHLPLIVMNFVVDKNIL